MKREEIQRVQKEEEKRYREFLDHELAKRIEKKEIERVRREFLDHELAKRVEREEIERVQKEEEKRYRESLDHEFAKRIEREEIERVRRVFLDHELAKRIERKEIERMQKGKEIERVQKEEEKRYRESLDHEFAKRIEREETERMRRVFLDHELAKRIEREETERVQKEEENRHREFLDHELAKQIEREETERVQKEEESRHREFLDYELEKRIEREEIERKYIEEEDDDDDEIFNQTKNGINKFKLLYACSNEPKNYRIGGLSAICKKDCGEDAYFELDQNNFMVFGIADGVGGWNKSGVDPSLFAWDLMNSCKDVTEDLDDWPDPKTILINGYDMVVRKKEVKAGSSTACILTLDKISGILYSTNLGDSGFTVIRDNKVVFKTQEQQHYFNAPYQLSIIPDTSVTHLQNTPHDAKDEQICTKEGDVIILGTDGLWDNMYNEDIIKVLKDDINNIKESKAEVKTREQYLAWEKETNEVLSGLSYQLTQQAKKYSQDRYRESPFSKKSSNTGQYHSGGKKDDITLILMYVTYDRFSNLRPKKSHKVITF